jgi:sporulation protein YlmC with PRC-barrel domain
MRTPSGLLAVVAATLSLVGTSRAAEVDRLSTISGNRSELVYSQHIIGERVANERGQTIGTIKELVINPDTGKVEFGVVTVSGGFLWMGEKTIVMPWQQFRLSPTWKGYVLSGNRPFPTPEPAPEPAPERRRVEQKPSVTTPPAPPPLPSAQPTNDVKQATDVKQFSGKVTAVDVTAGKIQIKGKLGTGTFNCGARVDRFQVGEEVEVDYREQYGIKVVEGIRPVVK